MRTMPRDKDGLTSRQAKFVLEYLIDLNATAAAKRAGYAPAYADRQAHQLLENTRVAAALAAKQAERAERTEETADGVLRDLRAVADRCMQGVEVCDSEGRKTGEWRFNASGANRALELIGKHLAMFIERKEVEFPKGVPVQVVRIVDDGVERPKA